MAARSTIKLTIAETAGMLRDAPEHSPQSDLKMIDGIYAGMRAWAGIAGLAKPNLFTTTQVFTRCPRSFLCRKIGVIL
jgi:hypothetical protein